MQPDFGPPPDAQNLQRIISGMGGGLHIGMIVIGIYFNYYNGILQSKELLPVLLLQYATLFVGWSRFYWMYVNTIAYFAPVNKFLPFVLDLFAYLAGGLVIVLTGKGWTTGRSWIWFFLLAITQGICLTRIWYTVVREARCQQQRYSKEDLDSLEGTFREMYRSILFITGVILLFVLLPSLTSPNEKALRIFSLVGLFIIVCVLYWRHPDPLYPVGTPTSSTSASQREESS